MAVTHHYWRFRAKDVRRNLAGVRDLDDLLTPSWTAKAESARGRSDMGLFLTMARLDPDDDETWDTVLNPMSVQDREYAAAARLMLALGDVFGIAGGFRSPPWFIEQQLSAAGWSKARIDLALRGMQHVTFFIAEVSPARAAAVETRFWLQGGWLDASTASTLSGHLDRTVEVLLGQIPQLSQILHSTTGMSEFELDDMLRDGVADLAELLSQPTGDTLVWIIQD